jgi:hypothetical protein
MDSQITSTYDIYKAVGYIALLLALAVPVSVLGMRLLNIVFGALLF